MSGRPGWFANRPGMRRVALAAFAGGTALATALLPALPAGAQPYTGTAAQGTLYFTTYQNQGTATNPTTNVWKVNYNWDGSANLTLGTPAPLAATKGADGIVFNPNNGDLLIGGQNSGQVFQVDPSTSNVASVNAGIGSTFMLAVDPSQQDVWTSGLPGTPALVPINPLAAGTAHSLQGGDGQLVQFAFVPDPNGTYVAGGQKYTVYYTDSDSNGVGSFGWLDTTTSPWTEHPLQTNLTGAHGMTYDPYSGDLILSGASVILQVAPSTSSFDEIAQLQVKTTFHLDQGAADGHGHLFIAGNGGYLHFIDYSQTKNISQAIVLNPVFVQNSLDDFAPMSGNGGPPPNQLPEVPYPVLLLPLLLIGLVPVLRHRRAAGDR